MRRLVIIWLMEIKIIVKFIGWKDQKLIRLSALNVKRNKILVRNASNVIVFSGLIFAKNVICSNLIHLKIFFTVISVVYVLSGKNLIRFIVMYAIYASLSKNLTIIFVCQMQLIGIVQFVVIVWNILANKVLILESVVIGFIKNVVKIIFKIVKKINVVYAVKHWFSRLKGNFLLIYT